MQYYFDVHTNMTNTHRAGPVGCATGLTAASRTRTVTSSRFDHPDSLSIMLRISVLLLLLAAHAAGTAHTRAYTRTRTHTHAHTRTHTRTHTHSMYLVSSSSDRRTLRQIITDVLLHQCFSSDGS